MVSRRDIVAGRAVVELGLNTAQLQTGVRSIPSLIAGLGIGAAIGTAFDIGQEFERSLANATSIVNATEAQLESLAQTSLRVAKDVKFSASELNEAFFFLFSAGQNIDQANQNLLLVSQFAQASRTDLSTAVDLLTDAQSAFNLVVDDATENAANLQRVSDVLVLANTKANATAAQLSEALTNKIAASARIANVSLEETVALLTVLADQGIKGAEAGTQLDIALREIQRRAINNPEGLANAGIRVFDNGNLRSTVDILRDIETALADLRPEGRRKLFSDLEFTERSVNSLLALVGTSGNLAIRLDELSDKEKVVGATARIADKQLTDFDRTVNKLSASVERLSVSFVASFGDVATELVDDVDGFVTRLNNSFDELDKLSDRSPTKAQRAVGQLGKLSRDFGRLNFTPDGIPAGQDNNRGEDFFDAIELASLRLSKLSRQIVSAPFEASGVGGGEGIIDVFDDETDAFLEVIDRRIAEVEDRLFQADDRLSKVKDRSAEPVEEQASAIDFLIGDITKGLQFAGQTAKVLKDAGLSFLPTKKQVDKFQEDAINLADRIAKRQARFDEERLLKNRRDRLDLQEEILRIQEDREKIINQRIAGSFTTASATLAADFLRSTSLPGKSVDEEIRDTLERIEEAIKDSELPAKEIKQLISELGVAE